MGLPIAEIVAGVFKPAVELIDSLHTSTEEKLQQKANLLQIQADAMDRALEYNLELFKGQQKIVEAEAKSEHWLTANWRPITMLTFLALTVGDSLGWLATPLRDEAWMLLQLGLGGYVVGRSAEKFAKSWKGGGKHDDEQPRT